MFKLVLDFEFLLFEELGLETVKDFPHVLQAALLGLGNQLDDEFQEQQLHQQQQQQQASTYLQQHRIHVLVDRLVRDLLEERPDDPSAWMQRWLLEEQRLTVFAPQLPRLKGISID